MEPGLYWVSIVDDYDSMQKITIAEYGPRYCYNKPGWLILGWDVPRAIDGEIKVVSGPITLEGHTFKPSRER